MKLLICITASWRPGRGVRRWSVQCNDIARWQVPPISFNVWQSEALLLLVRYLDPASCRICHDFRYSTSFLSPRCNTASPGRLESCLRFATLVRAYLSNCYESSILFAMVPISLLFGSGFQAISAFFALVSR